MKNKTGKYKIYWTYSIIILTISIVMHIFGWLKP